MNAGDPVRIGLIGAGWWASSVHLPALAGHPGAEIVALCDPDRGRAHVVARDHSIRHIFGDVESLIAAGVVDGVIIATPHVTHHSIARACLEGGLHVLVEKPMTTTAAHAFELIDIAVRKGVHLAVGYTYQCADTAGFVRAAVQTEIGELVQVVVQFSSNAVELFAHAGNPDGQRPDEPHPSTYSLANGGGQAHTQLTHAMGMVCWATGREVRDVVAFTDDRGLDVDVDDVAAFRFTGGGTGVAAATGTATRGQPVQHHVRYLGTHGTVDQDMLTAHVRLYRADGSVETRDSASDGDSYRKFRPAQAFVELIAGRGPNLGPARPAAATVAFLEAMLTAARTGQRVAVSQLPADAL